mmetsp:Transcript_29033/g.51983  ORF Transcript_29033/g.51983 Transcript_29033/m.51983 type:complete len:85 (+) Transcript_29033:63-317(+)
MCWGLSALAEIRAQKGVRFLKSQKTAGQKTRCRPDPSSKTWQAALPLMDLEKSQGGAFQAEPAALLGKPEKLILLEMMALRSSS